MKAKNKVTRLGYNQAAHACVVVSCGTISHREEHSCFFLKRNNPWIYTCIFVYDSPCSGRKSLCKAPLAASSCPCSTLGNPWEGTALVTPTPHCRSLSPLRPTCWWRCSYCRWSWGTRCTECAVSSPACKLGDALSERFQTFRGFENLKYKFEVPT